jgi:hypothetical protein
MNEPTFFAPPAAHYISANGPELVIPAEALQALVALAGERSGPGDGVTPSDIINEILGDYLAEKDVQKKLAAIDKADAEAERERVHALHGGEAA